MSQHIFRTSIVMMALWLTAGCAGTEDVAPAEPEGVDRAASEVERITEPEVSAEARETLASDNAAFALDLYRAARDDAGDADNLFFSPHSVSIALAMTYAGAEGETRAQMAEVLRFTLEDDELHAAFNELDADLAGRRTHLDVINAVWSQPGYAFAPSYLDLLAAHYGAGVYLLDFAADHEAARAVVNGWVAERTADHITELLAEGDVTPMTRMILTNAVYFNAGWKLQFDEDQTAEADFTRADGSIASVEMMHQRADLGVSQGEGWTAVELLYAHDEMSMIAILPQGDLVGLEDELTAGGLDELVGGFAEETIDLGLPKFGFNAELPLGELLQEMGMEAPFDMARADFSRMDPSNGLYIGAAVHQAYIDVSERGTEAAAATAVVMDERSAGPRSVVFDRPFLFLIRDQATGAILFLGRVADPTAA